ncbi:hypothetical protein [Cytobacillus horneckiae]|uniref:Uncharacterized protein n=1 Tax=Cytobacillus horneckiae TaxID=549687 RepID=A0A2N0ZMY3_9BACI|nr:hypothetical protein [Cytobacillus horneckiae]PKG30863.1 hypothetical protein CWS20_01210 [Cytobacillus horneckiae]
MEKFQVRFEFENGKNDFAIIEHNHLNNAIAKLQRDKWIKDESSGIYYNFDKVITFSVEEYKG